MENSKTKYDEIIEQERINNIEVIDPYFFTPDNIKYTYIPTKD